MSSLEQKRLEISKNHAALGVATLPGSKDLANDTETVNFYKERLAAWARSEAGSAFLRGKLGQEKAQKLILALEKSDGVYDDRNSDADMRRAVGLFQESRGNLRVDETIGYRTKFQLEAVQISPLREEAPPARQRPEPVRPKPEEAKPERTEVSRPPVVDPAKTEFDAFLKSVSPKNPFVQQARHQEGQRELTTDDRRWWQTKITEYEQVRSTVEKAHKDNPALKELMERIATAKPLTEAERNRFRSNIEGYNQVGHYHDNLRRLDPTYRAGSDPAANYFEGWNDRRRFQVTVTPDGRGGVDHVSVRKLGGDEPVIKLRAHGNYDLNESRGSGGAANWDKNRHLHSNIVIRVHPEMLTAKGATPGEAQWQTDVLRHERAHFYGGGESQARDAESRFKGRDHAAKFEEVIASRLYTRTEKAHTIVEHYIDRGTAVVYRGGRAEPNPEMVSWLGGSRYLAFVGGLGPEKSRQAGEASATPRRADLERNQSGFSRTFNPSDSEVRKGITDAFVAKSVDPIADRYRDIPNMTGAEKRAAEKQYAAELEIAEAQGRKNAQDFLKLLDARR